MGQRGPVKGKGGRPPGSTKKASSKSSARKATTRKKAAKKAERDFADDLLELGFEDFRKRAGAFRPLTPADRILLRVFWDTLERYRLLQAAVKASPALVFETEKGFRGGIPEVGMLNKCVEQLLSLAGRFGMSPADRVRMGEEPEPDTTGDPFADHMSRISKMSNESIETGSQPTRGRKVSRRTTQRKKASRKK